MLKQVSWADYCIALTICVAVYYLVVIVLYFRADLWLLLTGKKRLLPAGSHQADAATLSGDNADRVVHELEEEKLYDVVDRLIPAIKPLFEKGYIKEELVMALQQKLKDNGHLKGTAFQVAINNFIRLEADKQCSIRFSDEELRVLWP